MRIKEIPSTIEGDDKRFGLFQLLATLKWPEGYDGYMRSIGSAPARRMVSGYPSDSPSPPTFLRSPTDVSPRSLRLATGSGRREVSDDDDEAMGYGGLPFARPQSARYARPAGMYSDSDDQLQSAQEQLYRLQQENEQLRRSMMLSGSSISSPVEKEMAEMRAELTALRKDLFSSQQNSATRTRGAGASHIVPEAPLPPPATRRREGSASTPSAPSRTTPLAVQTPPQARKSTAQAPAPSPSLDAAQPSQPYREAPPQPPTYEPPPAQYQPTPQPEPLYYVPPGPVLPVAMAGPPPQQMPPLPMQGLATVLGVTIPSSGTWLDRFAALIEYAPVAMCITDMLCPGLPLTATNRAMAALTGYTQKELDGRNCRFLQGPATEASAIVAMVSAIRSRQPTTVQLTNYRK
jgi:PAS domain-containing protein